jgi:hypothetical protein
MAVLPFGQYQPDVSDLNRQYTRSILNVLPQGDGYGPFFSPQAYSAAAAADVRGVFYARKLDGSVATFMGTATKLYLLDNTSLAWTDVSKAAGTYTTLDAGANWSFVQFNDVVIASQNNDVMQKFTLASSSAFEDLGGSPPQAAYLAVVNRFVVAAGIASNPNRVQWCALNAIENWSTLESDSQDLPDGGAVQGIRGGDLGIIIQAGAIRRMVFSPGSSVIFDIDRIDSETGCDLPWSITEAAGNIFFVSQKGPVKIDPNGAKTFIGEERVSRTLKGEYDPAYPNLFVSGVNPEKNIVVWAYKTLSSGDTTVFDKALLYDYVQNKWAPIMLTGQALASVAQSGFTLESLGTIGSNAISGAADNGSGLIRLTVASTADYSTGQIKDVHDVGGATEANGTWTITVVDGTHIDLQGSTFSNAYTSGGYVAGSVDALEISLDDFSTATLPKMAIVNSDSELCFFTGDAMEATLETSEQTGFMQRSFINGMVPLTDAPTCHGSIAGRETLNATPSYSTEQDLNAQGFIPARVSTRHARAKLRIPSGTVWTYASGVDVMAQADGER